MNNFVHFGAARCQMELHTEVFPSGPESLIYGRIQSPTFPDSANVYDGKIVFGQCHLKSVSSVGTGGVLHTFVVVARCMASSAANRCDNWFTGLVLAYGYLCDLKTS